MHGVFMPIPELCWLNNKEHCLMCIMMLHYNISNDKYVVHMYMYVYVFI
jgi:hypothetical protein